MPSTYAVLGYSPHTALLGLGFPPRPPHGELQFIWHFTFFLTFPQRGVRPAAHCSVRWLGTTFQSTHPLRGATRRSGKRILSTGYFNPRTPCGVRLRQRRRSDRAGHISIHAPLAGCDVKGWHGPQLVAEISNHAPLAGCDGVRKWLHSYRRISIHAPLAGCDGVRKWLHSYRRISIHAPLAGCDKDSGYCIKDRLISIHAPLAGCDGRPIKWSDAYDSISIHAPLAGCDIKAPPIYKHIIQHFNPRTPCGVRLCTPQ